MRVVIDGLPIRGDNSLSVVAQHLLEGWDTLTDTDEVHLVVRAGAMPEVPDSVFVHEVRFGRLPLLSRIRAQSFILPRLCRSLAADVMLGVIPATAVTPLRCPRAVIAWDFRYRLLPDQFSRKARLLRRISYAIGFRTVKGVACISERTRNDLLSFHPRLARMPVRVAHLGADHVDSWPVRPKGLEYAIAFAHFANKNVDLVLLAWKELTERAGREEMLALRVVGVPDSDRARLQERIETLGLESEVTAYPWLSKDSFHEEFASSSLVVFPSDFEGFGLPAVEAMRLGIPLVITPEPALLEVTAGHATVMNALEPPALARAVATARQATPERVAAARQHAATYTWSHFAADVRMMLHEAMEHTPRLRPAWARTRLRLAGTAVAGAVALSGAAATAYALTAPYHAPPVLHPAVTTTSGGGTPVADKKTSAGSGPTASTGSAATPTQHSPTGAGSVAPLSRSGNTSNTSGSSGNPPSNFTVPTLPPLPTVTPPGVTVPTVPSTVPPVTIPGSVCTTTTAVGTTVVSTPCNLSAP